MARSARSRGVYVCAAVEELEMGNGGEEQSEGVWLRLSSVIDTRRMRRLRVPSTVVID
jgi:hypothetical protein